MIDLIPESSSAPPAARRRYNRRSVALALLMLPVTALAAWLAEADVPPAGVAAGLAGVFAVLLLFAYEFVQLMRSLDELQHRIHLTALVIGFASALLVLMALGIVSALTGLIGAEAWALIAILAVPASFLVYYVFLHVGLRRYR
ncbi:hypothetical protein E5163_09840 [Marinicauda algicola]|uniref:Uncharacterized protein n=1 Tax=Marinicauda algicola TaxID=2029849 RepID=A0A4S2GYH6_9PROT|nr:hypothetical protein [Marinicauda algicola]TGY88133.1 hypothetical protein E5163_09840 [Marinicauda algicola]